MKGDSALFWDWATFAVALWLAVPFVLTFILPKLGMRTDSTAIYRSCILIGLISLFLPTQFPLLWRIFWGNGPLVADLHLIELNQQVAVGTLCALAVLLYLLLNALMRLAARGLPVALLKRELGMLRRLGHFWLHNGDVQ